MLSYKVLSIQIPKFWETIKYVVNAVDMLSTSERNGYLTELLHALLNDKAQCFVILSDDKVLNALCITRILVDKFTGDKKLFIQNLYAFISVDNGSWQAGIDIINKFAKENNCKQLYCVSKNPRIWEIVTQYGFVEAERSFKLFIGGM